MTVPAAALTVEPVAEAVADETTIETPAAEGELLTEVPATDFHPGTSVRAP
ncbi:hypothetical protein H7I58_22835, partial [Mycolicibacterium moriokaense]|nr:hypothetical protein [Mycolicibacterium moriokaense]